MSDFGKFVPVYERDEKYRREIAELREMRAAAVASGNVRSYLFKLAMAPVAEGKRRPPIPWSLFAYRLKTVPVPGRPGREKWIECPISVRHYGKLTDQVMLDEIDSDIAAAERHLAEYESTLTFAEYIGQDIDELTKRHEQKRREWKL